MNYIHIILISCFVYTASNSLKVQTLYQKGIYTSRNKVTVNSSSECVLSFESTKSKNPYRITATASEALTGFPVMIVTRQEKQVTSWQIPLIVDSKDNHFQFRDTARTLCYNNLNIINSFYRSNLRSLNDVDNSFSVAISTFSPNSVEVSIEAKEVTNYYIKNNRNYTVEVSPSRPAFYYYSFDENHNENRTILVDIDSYDEHCVMVSIQKSFCPVRDLNSDITFEGHYTTINRKGSFYISKMQYPEGFFLVFVVRGDNYECSGNSSLLPSGRKYIIHPQNKTSILYFTVSTGISSSDYYKGVFVILGTYLAFCVLFFVISFFLYKYKRAIADTETDGFVELNVKLNELVESEIRLSALDTKNSNKRKSSNYCYHIANIGLFYGLPVVQLMISYQRSVNLIGDQDICYHNFLCAHPFMMLNDFNHIYSNIGYLLAGALFIALTYSKDKITKYKEHHGIPKHYGLFYAMGMALIMEGVLSACYHICPNQTNFQFDTSFMYVMAVLIMVKLYQFRHPDLNATAYATFTVLGATVFLAMIGIMSGSLIVIILFLISYVLLCLYISIKIYCFGFVVNTLKSVHNSLTTKAYTEAFLPLRKRLFLILITVNMLNYIMAGMGFYLYPTIIDFGTYVLMLLMGNAFLYVMFYVSMKLYYKEKLCGEAIFYTVLCLGTWLSSVFFFFDPSTVWTVTPAESRHYNHKCIFLKFYDGHDIWHMLSAPALFFSFMLLLTVDDDLKYTKRNDIHVF